MTVVCICITCILAMMNSFQHLSPSFSSVYHQSRTCKRRHARERCGTKRKIMAVMFICGMGQAAAMGQQQKQEAMLQRVIMALAEAATRAAIAAGSVAARSAQPPSSSGGGGLQAAAKILKSPDMFSGDDALAFPGSRFQFTSWLAYGESRYVQMLQNIEAILQCQTSQHTKNMKRN